MTFETFEEWFEDRFGSKPDVEHDSNMREAWEAGRDSGFVDGVAEGRAAQ
jgi:hypothetical protein